MNVAALRQENQNAADVHDLLAEAINAYLGVARRIAASGSATQAGYAIASLSNAVAHLSDRDRKDLAKGYDQLQLTLREKAAGR